MAGPSDRAGFIDAPEIGLPAQNHLTNQYPGAKLLEFDITLKRSLSTKLSVSPAWVNLLKIYFGARTAFLRIIIWLQKRRSKV